MILIAGLAFQTITAPALRADESTLLRAEQLVNSSQHAAAVALLTPLENTLAGDARYDYLYGLALLETGEIGRAIFALQRVVDQNEQFAGARLDLARAYYLSGSYGEAREQFEVLRDQNPPPAAREAIDSYLALIANRQNRLRFEYRLGSKFGYDSNANSATSANEFLGFDLIEQSRETSSPFGELGGGVVLLKPISARLLLDTRLNVRRRNNPDASFVNAMAWDAAIGVKQVGERITRSLRLQSYRVDIDGRLNSKGQALAGSWELRVRDDLLLGFFGRLGQTRYGDALKIKDVDQYLFGASAGWTFGGVDQGSLGASLLAGTDDPRIAGSRYGRDLYGIRLSAAWRFNAQIRAQFTAGLMQSDYDAVFFEQQFTQPREDTMGTVAVNVLWRLTPTWVMSHEISYSNNDSNIDIFKYERVETSLSFYRYWR